MPLWNEIEGKSLDGLPLEKLLRSEGRTAWFATIDPDQRPGVLSVFEALNDEEAVQARLEAGARVQHPNLLVIRGTGTARLDDESLVYAVMEPFDQTLGEVLRERPLSPDETRDVAESLLSALETVEAAGLHHGHVDASGVLAVGDGIKLRSDCMTQRQGQQSDAPGLAALIYNALTGRRFSNERDAIQLPAPFATFVRAGIGNNGTLAAMRRVLSGANVTSSGVVADPIVSSTSASAVAPVAQVEAALPARTTAVASGLGQQAAARGPVPGAGIPRAALGEIDERPRKRPGVAIAAVVIMVILLAVFWYMFKRPLGHTPISGEASTSANPPDASAPAPSTPPPAPAEPPASATKPSAAATEPHTAAPVRRPSAATPAGQMASVVGERSVWHVVVYTYNREEAAQRKASELATRYPQFQPQSFSPTGHAPFLVVLGGGTDRQGAFARREAARAAGLPSDTYAQNFRK